MVPDQFGGEKGKKPCTNIQGNSNVDKKPSNQRVGEILNEKLRAGGTTNKGDILVIGVKYNKPKKRINLESSTDRQCGYFWHKQDFL